MSWLGEPLVDEYKGLHLKYLLLNQAYVTANVTSKNVFLYGVDRDCFTCPLKLIHSLIPYQEDAWPVDTNIQYTWRVMNRYNDDVLQNDKRGLHCELRPNLFGDFGVYRLDIGKCSVDTELAPTNPYPSLLLFVLILLMSLTLYGLTKFILKRKARNEDCEQKLVLETDNEKLQSITTFRGLLVLLLVFAMSGGGEYPIFKRSWGGLSITECLFFIFMWTIGVSIPTVVNRALSDGKTKCIIIRDILFRAAILVISGVAISSALFWSGTYRRSHLITLWHALERIGVSYFVAATAYVLTVRKFEVKSKATFCKAMGNLISLVWCWVLSAFLFVILVLLILTLYSFNCQSYVNITDHPTDYYSLVTKTTFNCNNGMTRNVNDYLVAASENIVWVNGFFGFYSGLLGFISSILYVMIGLKTGTVYEHHESHSDRLKLWAFWATLFGLGGVTLAAASLLLNFNFLPASTILVITTMAVYIYMIIYVVSEVYKFTSTIFIAPGLTSLIILAGHITFKDTPPLNFQENFHSHFYFLLQSYFNVIVWIIVAIFLMKNRVKLSACLRVYGFYLRPIRCHQSGK